MTLAFTPTNDRERALGIIEKTGVGKLNLSFSSNQDIDGDGARDVWGAPHMHCWVHERKAV